MESFLGTKILTLSGFYPHEEVSNKENKPIQTGVYYSPDIHFYAFDIGVEKNNEIVYLDYNKSIDLFQEAKLFYAEPLKICSFKEALEYNYDFESTIPKKLGMKSINDNKAEGIVIKPLTTLYTETIKGKERVILKLKPARFKEDKRYNESKKWDESNKFELTNLQILEYELDSLLTEQRVENTISKIGEIKTKEEGKKLLKYLNEEIQETIMENNGKEMKELTKVEKEEFNEKIKKECKSFCIQYFNKKK
jgi:Rnl2 family RNA ligase